MIDREKIPAEGLAGLKENWRSDAIAAISVALVALPLALGIAIASGVTPIAGILSAVIGGIVTTLFRGSHLAINGPAAGLIAVILGGLAALDGNINYVLAAIVISGAIQVVLGILKLGRFAKMFPPAVLHGILAAIGIIIIAKQVHFALGLTSTEDSILGTIKEAIVNIDQVNPFVAIIAITSLLLLVYYKRIPFRIVQLLPAPMWVLLLSLPFVFGFDFFTQHTASFFGNSYEIGPAYLIAIPDNPLEGLMHPDFGMIGTSAFWFTVISITLISSVQTLAMARAVDKLDPYKRTTDLNKDLIGLGLSTMVSGALGGLPIITVIVRSTVNIQNNAKTKWSNLFHGVILLLFVLLLAPLLQSIPLAALAAILIHTGFKLASPKAFYNTYDQGVEQLLFMTSTIVLTLLTDLLIGIVGGIAIALVLHMLLAKVGFWQFFEMIFKSGSKVYKQEDGSYDLKLKGIANFLFVLELDKLLASIPMPATVKIDMSKTLLVDASMMENVIEYKRIQDTSGGNTTIQGLDNHWSSTSHNRGLKIIVGPRKRKITKRQIALQKMAIQHGWSFEREVDWDTSYLRNFLFFEARPLERKTNSLRGKDLKHNVTWEIADVTFDEGAMLSLEVFHTTVLIIRLNQEIPKFIVEKEGLFDKIFDRVKALSGYTDYDLKLYPKVSKKFLLMTDDKKSIEKLFSKELIKFLEKSKIQHIESNGEALMIFKYLHKAPAEEIQNMLSFSEELVDKMALENSPE